MAGSSRARGRRARMGVALAASAAAMAGGAGPASAATVALSGSTLTFEAGAAEANDARMFLSVVPGAIAVGDEAVVHDPSGATVPVAIQAGQGCAVVNRNTVRCENAVAAATTLVVNLGDGDDRFENDVGETSTINGGDGKDWLEGGSGLDTIYGGLGDDTLLGHAKTDQLFGEAGSDTLDVRGEGSDTANCGADADTVFYVQGVDALIDCERANAVAFGPETGGVSPPTVPPATAPPPPGGPPPAPPAAPTGDPPPVAPATW